MTKAVDSMISMTGFGMASHKSAELTLDVEIKSVNSRYLDLVFKLPREYNAFELELRQLLSKKIQRGRVEIQINRRALGKNKQTPVLDRALFDSIYAMGRGLLTEMKLDSEAERAALLREILARREILELVEVDLDTASERGILLATLEQALQKLCESRAREGQALARDCASRLNEVKSLKAKLTKSAAAAPQAARQRLAERLARLAPDITVDALRLGMEVAILADRVDVSEELTRLDAHLEQFEEVLKLASSGRRLDFLLQEIGREFNTISSKCQDAAMQSLVVDAKSSLEKIREQVQNAE